MILLEKDFLNNTQLSVHFLEDGQNFINDNINIQKRIKNTLLNYMQNFVNSDNIDSISFSCDFLKKSKNFFNICNDNISRLQSLLNKLNHVIDSTQKKDVNIYNIIKQYNEDYTRCVFSVNNATLKIGDYLCYLSKNSKLNITSNISEKSSEQEIVKKLKETQATIQANSSKEPLLDKKSQNFTSTNIPNQIETKPETKVNAKTEIQAEAKVNAKTEIQAEAKVDAKTEIQAEAKVDTKTETQVETKVDEKIQTQVETNVNAKSEATSQYVENTLIISEFSDKVILPFNMSEVKELFENNKDIYSSINDVIYKEYTLPLKSFKSPFISRFKEGYKLMRNKEHASISQSIDLGIELMFNHHIHPAVITACNSLDELDAYLDYIDSNFTTNFNYFKILFEIPPTKTVTR